MAKFCTRCGKPLIDGQPCDCMKSSAQTGASQDEDRTVRMDGQQGSPHVSQQQGNPYMNQQQGNPYMNQQQGNPYMNQQQGNPSSREIPI